MSAKRTARRDRAPKPGPGARIRRSTGLTMVELMIAMVILAGGLLAMASVQLESIRGSQRGRHFTYASTIAASQVERLQGETWNDIPVTAWTAPVLAQTVMGRAEPGPAYRVQWQIRDLVPGRVRAIDVRVLWQETSGQARTFVMSGVRNNHEGV